MRNAVIGIILLQCVFFQTIEAQSDCFVSVGSVYGSPMANERAKCLVATAEGDGFFLGGFTDDSVLLARINLEGMVLWSRTMEILPGQTHDINSIFLDSEGMLAVVGTTGGSIPGDELFVFRYNPTTHQILWARDISSAQGNEAYCILQKGNGANYVISNNPSHTSASNNDSELLEINKNTGTIIPGFSRDYHLGNSEHLVDLVFYENFIYGVGRYTDGFVNSKMRHALVKINPNNGAQMWVKLGHVPANLSARLYGIDLVIDNDEIYSIYFGDPVGINVSNNKLFIQKTGIDGTLIWAKQYDLPGSSDEAYEIIKSGDGYVVLGLKAAPAPKEIVLFKINSNGDVIWSKLLDPSAMIASSTIERAASQLIEVGGNLIFTATGLSTNGSSDMLIVRTDLDGNVANECMNSVPVSVPVININTAVFYSVTPIEFSVSPITNGQDPEPVIADLMPSGECSMTDTLYGYQTISICTGESYEGYSLSGEYVDYFVTNDGCDSVNTLNLTVLDPLHTFEQHLICLGESYLGYGVTGSYMDEYESVLGCDSIHQLELSVIPLETSLDVSICEGEEYAGYQSAGSFVDTLQGPPNECDTVRYLELTIVDIEQTFLSVSICTGEIYEGYSSTGVYEDVFTGISGCDSVRILDLVVSNQILSTLNISICPGEMYGPYSMTGVYVDSFSSAFGCDSIRTLHLDVQLPVINLDWIICKGEIYLGHASTGDYIDTISGGVNCDTILLLDLTVLPLQQIIIDHSVCEGEIYLGYMQTGIYVDTFQSTNGCDSIRQLMLEVISPVSTEEFVQICAGKSFEHYDATGMYVDTFLSSAGCDSLRILSLTIESPVATNVIGSLCIDDFAKYTEEGVYVDTLISITGCDSVRILEIKGGSLFIPNVFSPNGDGVNDFLELYTSQQFTPTIEYFAIFDRFGTMTYQTSTWPVRWEGFDKHKQPSNPGVFAYLLTYQCRDQIVTETGDITLIR